MLLRENNGIEMVRTNLLYQTYKDYKVKVDLFYSSRWNYQSLLIGFDL